ncbi:MAG: exodeoxyribonuclease I [Xanthomonadales bacterium]|jgi:exodeoxyribonuclease-1|nr:exodeoxyribonuclease I [Xanthomonadales bacterium]
MSFPANFLWHDYETFGTHPAYDRPVQFAALRTDADLNPIGDPMAWFARPMRDSLPHPMACLVTGITPQRAEREGVPEAEFARLVHEQMMEPGTCSVGYNSVRFDDNVSRHLFYRNFYDPYEREYANGNSRWDLIDLVRMCYALRPEGINWPMRAEEPDLPSFRLEDLTAANDIEHAGAHDALVDVEATVALARRLLAAQPKLFAWGLEMRHRDQVEKILSVQSPRPLVLTSGLLPAARGCTTLVLPLAPVPDRPREVVCYDLMSDPAPLMEGDVEAIRAGVFTPAAERAEDEERIPLLSVATNKIPMLAPLGTLKQADLDRIGLDPERCLGHARTLQDALEIVRPKLRQVYERPPFDDPGDPDGALYSGSFFSRKDKAGFTRLRSEPPEALGRFDYPFEDSRIDEMIFRYRARNWPETLSATEQKRWERERLQRLLCDTVPGRLSAADFRVELRDARADHASDPKAQSLLDELAHWVETEVLTDGNTEAGS